MTIIESHDGTKNAVWHAWLKSGLTNDKITLYPLAKIVQYPKIKDTTLLHIGLYMLEKLPEIERFCRLSTSSRQHEPICHHTKPVIIGQNMNRGMDNTSSKQVLKTPSQSAKLDNSNMAEHTPGKTTTGINPQATSFTPKRQLFQNSQRLESNETLTGPKEHTEKENEKDKNEKVKESTNRYALLDSDSESLTFTQKIEELQIEISGETTNQLKNVKD